MKARGLALSNDVRVVFPQRPASGGVMSIQPVNEDPARKGPAIGTRFPDLVLPDQSGTPVRLHDARRGRRALVVFYRSARW
jgi:hypothetical protein